MAGQNNPGSLRRAIQILVDHVQYQSVQLRYGAQTAMRRRGLGVVRASVYELRQQKWEFKARGWNSAHRERPWSCCRAAGG
eukprot:355872-Chlamydomonas_euryale.AAC.7